MKYYFIVYSIILSFLYSFNVERGTTRIFVALSGDAVHLVMKEPYSVNLIFSYFSLIFCT